MRIRLITAELATGRTHQIRVHLASVGHPLVGDRRYGARGRLPTRPSVELLEAIRGFRRQALHAAELEFAHPTTDAPLSFASPLPEDLVHLIALLAARSCGRGRTAERCVEHRSLCRTGPRPLASARRPTTRQAASAAASTRRSISRRIAVTMRRTCQRTARAWPRQCGTATVCWMNQVHGADVVDADLDHAVLPAADAAVSLTARRACAILTADCVPVLVCDRAGTMVGAAHCGWRGLAHGVLGSLCDACRPRRENLIAWMGPAIGPERYEVGRDVRDALLDAFSIVGRRAGAAAVATAGNGQPISTRSRVRNSLARRARVSTEEGSVLTTTRVSTRTGATASRAGWQR